MSTIDPRFAPRAVADWLASVRPEIDAAITRALDRTLPPASDDPGRLGEAMRYAVLGEGKRLRPALCLAACGAITGEHDIDIALPAAAAIEMLHAYTLVHDDLPAMDDDDMRRGRPTVHVAFGEAIAILAGDGLLTAAFASLAELGPRAADAVAVLACRAGARELLSGQARDLALGSGKTAIDWVELEKLHAAKTGALFAAAAELGGIAAGASGDERARLGRWGLAFGIAFQHADDRDDGDFPEHRQVAGERMKALATEAENLARSFAPHDRLLLAIAGWLASRA